MAQALEKEQETVVNGVNIDVVNDTIEVVRKDPAMAHSTFKISSRWDGGTRTTMTVGDMYAAKQAIPHKAPYAVQADEPEMLSGTDTAPNPVELLLAGLASCVTTSVIAHASVRGIEIRSLVTEIDGDIDLNGFLDLDPTVAKGYSGIRLRLKIDTPHDNLEEVEALHRFSPVFNTLLHGTTLSVEAERA